MAKYQEVLVEILTFLEKKSSGAPLAMTIEERMKTSTDPGMFAKLAAHMKRWTQASLALAQTDKGCQNFEKMLHYCCKHPKVEQFYKRERKKKQWKAHEADCKRWQEELAKEECPKLI